jgi:GH25 family lysozyme M1 (1,4-beta-N-acetylmuramidase)
MIFVIDISNWQGNVNSSLWLPMNVHGAIAKALEGKTGIDKQWANYALWTLRNLDRWGIPWGIPGRYRRLP